MAAAWEEKQRYLYMVPELWRVVEGRVRTPRHDEVEGGRTGGVYQLTRRADIWHRAGYRQDGILA